MATRRNRKNGRFSKTSRRTSRKKSFNVTRALETYLISNASLRAITGSNIPTFFTGKKIGDAWGKNGTNNSWDLTAPELIDMLMGGSGGMSKEWQARGLMEAVKKNMQVYGGNAIATAILAPMAFRLGKQVLRKPIINPANRVLKTMGVKEVKL